MPIKKGPVHPLNLYVISDSTANLVRHMLAAFLTQFPPGTFHVRQMSFVQGVDDLDHAFTLIAAAPGPVAHAVILPALKQAIGKRCKVMKLLCHDLTGPTVEFLAKAAGIEPLVDTSRLHLVDAEYQRRIDAMEYTLNHDDGLGIATLAEADVVLVGVSRVSKTPTGILLAQRGLRAANVALAQ